MIPLFIQLACKDSLLLLFLQPKSVLKWGKNGTEQVNCLCSLLLGVYHAIKLQ